MVWQWHGGRKVMDIADRRSYKVGRYQQVMPGGVPEALGVFG